MVPARLTIMKATKEERNEQRLLDRRAYRQTLINRRNELDTKISRVEQDIRELGGKPAKAA